MKPKHARPRAELPSKRRTDALRQVYFAAQLIQRNGRGLTFAREAGRIRTREGVIPAITAIRDHFRRSLADDVLQPAQALAQAGQAGVGNVRVDQLQPPQLCHAGEVLQGGVRDVGALQRQVA